MSIKITIDSYCDECGSEYMITYDQDNQLETPNFCSSAPYPKLLAFRISNIASLARLSIGKAPLRT